MKKKIVLFFFIGFLFAQNGITYKLNGGRFGDNVFNFVRALWLSHKHNLTLEYTPFPYSNLLRINTFFSKTKHYDKTIIFNHENVLKEKLKYLGNCLFVQNFYTYVGDPYTYRFEYPEFNKLLQEVLTPINKERLLALEKTDSATVAIHIRKPSKSDSPLFSPQLYNGKTAARRASFRFSDKMHPAKFPPTQYYIDQIADLSSYLGDPPLHVYIFTDYADPKGLTNTFIEKIAKDNIEYHFFQDNNGKDALIRDYWLMSQCDYLIRSHSYFSLIAQLVGHHKIIITPCRWRWEKNFLHVYKVRIFFANNDSFKKVEVDSLLTLQDEDNEDL